LSWGHLFDEQRLAVQRVIAGRHVVDLGAGDLSLAHELLELGASRVTAVDINPCESWGPLSFEPVALDHPAPAVAQSTDRLRLVVSSFADFTRPDDAEIAFLSWCDSYPKLKLVELLATFPTLIHLSKNTDSVVCGWPQLYAYLKTRRITAYHPRRRNTLVVYAGGPVERPARPEEIAGESAAWSLSRYESLCEEVE